MLSDYEPTAVPDVQQLTQPSQLDEVDASAPVQQDNYVATGGKFTDRMKYWIPLVGGGLDSCALIVATNGILPWEFLVYDDVAFSLCACNYHRNLLSLRCRQ